MHQLTELLKPTYLEISNDSHAHRGHAAMVAVGGGNGETRKSVSHSRKLRRMLIPTKISLSVSCLMSSPGRCALIPYHIAIDVSLTELVANSVRLQ